MHCTLVAHRQQEFLHSTNNNIEERGLQHQILFTTEIAAKISQQDILQHHQYLTIYCKISMRCKYSPWCTTGSQSWTRCHAKMAVPLLLHPLILVCYKVIIGRNAGSTNTPQYPYRWTRLNFPKLKLILSLSSTVASLWGLNGLVNFGNAAWLQILWHATSMTTSPHPITIPRSHPFYLGQRTLSNTFRFRRAVRAV